MDATKKTRNVGHKTDDTTTANVLLALVYLSIVSGISILSALLWKGFEPDIVNIWLIVVGFSLFLSYPFSRQKRLSRWSFFRRYSEFGEWLWNFDSLWFVVFLVGIYATAALTAEKFIVDGLTISDSKVWLGAARDMIVTTFLAVVTSVIANTFKNMQSGSENISAASENMQEVVDLIKIIEQNIGRELKTSQTTLRTLTGMWRSSQRQAAINTAADKLKVDSLSIPLKRMIRALQLFNDSVLHPLLPPEKTLPDENNDLVARIPKDLLENEQHRPHYACMSAAVWRSLESQLQESAFRGVILEPTSFAYYIESVGDVVKSLEPWWNRFHFFTLMPESPLRLFQFGNTIDFPAWLGFLEYYNEFQTRAIHEDSSRAWRRFFAFYDTSAFRKSHESSTQRFFPCKEDVLRSEFSRGFLVVKKEEDWMPAKITKGERQQLLKSLGDKSSDSRKFSTWFSDFHGDYGTFVTKDMGLSDNQSTVIDKYKWKKLAGALMDYHGGEERYNNQVRFRCMTLDNVVLEHRTDQSAGSLGGLFALKGSYVSAKEGPDKPIERAIEMPSDIFAVFDVENDAWKLLICRDPGALLPDESMVVEGRESRIRLTSCLTIDLEALSIDVHNNDTSHRIRHFLDRLFMSKTEGAILEPEQMHPDDFGANSNE